MHWFVFVKIPRVVLVLLVLTEELFYITLFRRPATMWARLAT